MRKQIATTVAIVSLVLFLPLLQAGISKGTSTHSPPGPVVQTNVVVPFIAPPADVPDATIQNPMRMSTDSATLSASNSTNNPPGENHLFVPSRSGGDGKIAKSMQKYTAVGQQLNKTDSTHSIFTEKSRSEHLNI